VDRLISLVSVASIVAAAAGPVQAADRRYPAGAVMKIEIVEPSSASVWEDKNLLDCFDVVLTEEDVRYALRHMRRISEKSFFDESTERTGCSGAASVTFKNGKTIVIGAEPTGRINVFEADAKLEPVGVPGSYYKCDPCRNRKMTLLKDAFDLADERRLKRLEAEGRIPADEANRRLEKARAERGEP
jgi:hypothetical protein